MKNLTLKHKVVSTKMNYLVALIFMFTVFQLCGCSDTTESSSNLNAENKNANNADRFANQDFSNKPVNLNLEKDRKEFDKKIDELNQNRKLWKEQNFTNYDFTMQQWAEGMGNDWKLNFKVRENKPIPFENMTYPELHKYQDLETIDELFDYIECAMEKGWKVFAKYNKQHGYPLEISNSSGYDTGYNNKKIVKFEIVK